MLYLPLSDCVLNPWFQSASPIHLFVLLDSFEFSRFCIYLLYSSLMFNSICNICYVSLYFMIDLVHLLGSSFTIFIYAHSIIRYKLIVFKSSLRCLLACQQLCCLQFRIPLASKLDGCFVFDYGFPLKYCNSSCLCRYLFDIQYFLLKFTRLEYLCIYLVDL